MSLKLTIFNIALLVSSFSWSNETQIDFSFLKEWGLGLVEEQYISNNIEQDWYIDQANTGEHSNDNCGPSSVTMAGKWFNKGSFTHTAEDARNSYRPEGGWWYTDDIMNYLDDVKVPYFVIEYTNEDDLLDAVFDGNIILICNNMGYIKRNYNPNERVGRFYQFNSGHFLILKGIRLVDGKWYIESYDPNSWDKRYSSGEIKGLDRYYSLDELTDSINNWWNYLIIIPSKENIARKSSRWNSIDPKTIKHAWGK